MGPTWVLSAPWWPHQPCYQGDYCTATSCRNVAVHLWYMVTLWNGLLALCERNPSVTSGFPSQWDNNSELWSFFDVSLNKLLDKQVISRDFRRHFNADNFVIHDDVIKWKQFPRNRPFVRGIHRSPVNSRTKAVTRSFDVFIDLRRNNDWVNTRETGDLRRYRAHYDVIVMYRHHRFMDNHCFCRPMTTVPVLYRVQKRYTYTLCFNLTKPNLTWPLPYLTNEVNPCSLIRKCRHCDEIIITDCTGSCHFDNFRCSRWWKFHQNDNISVSVVS